MNDQVKKEPQTPQTPFEVLDNQETRTLVDLMGIYVRGAVEDYEFNGQSGKTGFIQLLQKNREDSARMKLETIKVQEDQYGMIDILNKNVTFKNVRLNCEIRTSGNQSKTYLIQEQKHIKLG